jgi:hypothetical protein
VSGLAGTGGAVVGLVAGLGVGVVGLGVEVVGFLVVFGGAMPVATKQRPLLTKVKNAIKLLAVHVRFFSYTCITWKEYRNPFFIIFFTI